MSDKVLMSLPAELAERLDEIAEFLDFGSGERLVEALVRRFLDDYRLMTRELHSTL